MSDSHLEAMQHELRVLMARLNDLHHPVQPADPLVIKRLEAEVAELRQAIAQRRRHLTALASPAAVG